ncbi:cupredoxin domain-containing protein [Sanguibacter antarcticus]|uniref:Plastocyanin n=1 Tax=Sanguibacter antarcticus TaxID=372484 RepID=A0A2A9E6N7_9MICO|nr:cupredoxin domain-containing protein [Sanguibacter antarcticus]PFG34316.1 plastocyanin [Sanguibacter antarcticus]
MFHRDIRQASPLCPANRLCKIGREHRDHRRRCATAQRSATSPRLVPVRHATAFRRTSACLTVFALGALSACAASPEAASGTSVAADGTLTVTIDMKDMRFHPAVVDVEPGTRVVVTVRNSDGMPHDLFFDDAQSTDLLSRDESATIDLGVLDETLEGWCTVSGHRAAGMTLTLKVA